MTTASAATRPSGARVFKSLATGVIFTAVVVVMLLWLAGRFAPKVNATPGVGPHDAPWASYHLVPVEVRQMPRTETAVGTIRAVHDVAVASKLLAKVLVVNAQAGQDVRRGDVLVKLDDRDLVAQVGQAEAAVAAAQAAADRARLEFERVKPLYEKGVETKSAFDNAEAADRAAVAELERARQARDQAQSMLDDATVKSPIAGRIVDKHVEAGDFAQPGQVLVTLYDPTRMQLVATVRESLASHLTTGQAIGVEVDALHKTCDGQVSEIVPEAESASRSFSVKVTGPCPPGIYSGMFGRLLIPLGEEELLVIPGNAVQQVGQLTIVFAANTANAANAANTANTANASAAGQPNAPAGSGDAGRTASGGAAAHGPASAGARDSASAGVQRRVVQLGRTLSDGAVEVLSGLRAGEAVAVPTTK